MSAKDQFLIAKAYEQVLEEGFGKTLGTLALGVMGILGAKEAAERSGAEYTQGLPSLKTPDDNTAKNKIDSYLNKVGMINVKADDKHLKALDYISKNSPDQEISQRAKFILDKQQRISQQR